MRIAAAAPLAAAALIGCGGSGDGLAPAARPAPAPPLDQRPAGHVVEGSFLAERAGGRRARIGDALAVLHPRRRELSLVEADTRRKLDSVDVGIGPTHVVARGRRLFVVDTRGDALLELHPNPLRVHRRTHLAGSPYGIAFDIARRRFWVALTARNQLAELTDRRLLRTFPTVRGPVAVAVAPATGRVVVTGQAGTTQVFDPPPYRP